MSISYLFPLTINIVFISDCYFSLIYIYFHVFSLLRMHTDSKFAQISYFILLLYGHASDFGFALFPPAPGVAIS